jgi:hypothetical protein
MFLLPWLIIFLRMLKIKIVVTSHIVISAKQLNKDFFENFPINILVFILNKMMLIEQK